MYRGRREYDIRYQNLILCVEEVSLKALVEKKTLVSPFEDLIDYLVLPERKSV